MLNRYSCVDALCRAGISHDDAIALRRISMTLHRWHELECGDGDQYGSWCITRGRKIKTKTADISHGYSVDKVTIQRETFEHDDDGKPYLEHHHYTHGAGKDSVSYSPIPDRERGALKRLAKIMARYPGFASYVQGDPRGCALYILRPGDVPVGITDKHEINYTRGIAVYK